MYRAHDRYGWRPSPPDIRDRIMPPVTTAPTLLPASVDLRPQMPPIGDQGQLGSCTAWAATAAYRYEMGRQKLTDFEGSELAQYYWTRQLEGAQYVRVDAGATIRDAVKNLAQTGMCPEADWPYVVSKFKTAPPTKAHGDAKKHLALEYLAVPQTITDVKGALASGLPVVIGITVYASFESDAVASTGIVPMPGPKEATLGGHALLLVGYDDATHLFTTRNSWGTGFGDKGYVYLPMGYVGNPNLASDFWVIRHVG